MFQLSSKNNLRRHLLTHQNNYECPDCCQVALPRVLIQMATEVSQYPPTGQAQVLPGRVRSGRRIPTGHPRQPGHHPNQHHTLQVVSLPFSLYPPRSYFCKQCPSSFFSFKGYKEHKALHYRLRPHLCWTCHKSFRTAGDFSQIQTRDV